jgi:hypothetical protein
MTGVSHGQPHLFGRHVPQRIDNFFWILGNDNDRWVLLKN